MIKEKGILDPVDFYNQTNKGAAQMLLRLNNSWLLRDICAELF